MITIVTKPTTPNHVFVGKGSPLENQCADKTKYGDWLMHCVETDYGPVMHLMTKIIRLIQQTGQVELVIGKNDSSTEAEYIKKIIQIFIIKTTGMQQISTLVAAAIPGKA